MDADYLIIGAGPGGLQTGYYLQQAGRSYYILEAGEGPGSFFKIFPRHRKLISINKVYTGYDDPEINLRWDWNSLLSEDEKLLFKRYTGEYFPSADDIVTYLGNFAAHFNLKITYQARVTRITRAESRFRIIDNQGRVYTCARLIIATGYTKPYIPSIPGIELAEQYGQVSIRPDDFVNQSVLIIGKGNSAFETADNLIPTSALIHLASPHPLQMAWNTHYVGHLRAINNNLLDTYQLKSQNAIMDTQIERIARKGDKFVVSFHHVHALDEREDLTYDRVIVCTGFRFDASLFDETCQPELTIHNRFPLQTSEWESANIKDLYFAGALMHMRDYRKTTSGFIHGFRYNIRALHFILEQKYHGRALPYRLVEADPQSLTETIIQQVNRSSALWQQFGFLGDLIIMPGEGTTACYYEGLPIDYIHDSPAGQHANYYIVTLEYGHRDKGIDLFNADRVRKDDSEHAQQSTFLHPIIRHFAGPTLLAEHHIIEDFQSRWLEDEHIQPLLHFLRREEERIKEISTG